MINCKFFLYTKADDVIFFYTADLPNLDFLETCKVVVNGTSFLSGVKWENVGYWMCRDGFSINEQLMEGERLDARYLTGPSTLIYCDESSITLPYSENVLKILTKYEFFCRFTASEKTAIFTQMDTNLELKILWETIKICDEIDLNDDEINDGLDYLISLSIITEARKTVILNGDVG